jgi:hypothetical protein
MPGVARRRVSFQGSIETGDDADISLAALRTEQFVETPRVQGAADHRGGDIDGAQRSTPVVR